MDRVRDTAVIIQKILDEKAVEGKIPYCMDVPEERKQLAEVIAEELETLRLGILQVRWGG